jgi:hypothetical protein
MSAETKKEIQLEIAHVLFIDIVGYSKLSINEQHAAVDELTQIVRATAQFQKADASERLIKIATGDGMALVFYTIPEAPVRCAIELRAVHSKITRAYSSEWESIAALSAELLMLRVEPISLVPV